MAKLEFIRTLNGVVIEKKGSIELVLNIGQSGASAYKSYLATTTDDPKLTEAQWSASFDQIQSDWNQTVNTEKDYIKNKPTIPDEGVQSVTSTDNHIVVDNTDLQNPLLSFQTVDNENFLTDDELANLNNQSGTNTGDQDLSGLQLTSEKGDADGYAGLDENAKILLANIPDAILGNVKFKGTWNLVTDIVTSGDPIYNNFALPLSDSTTLGIYFILTSAGTFETVDYQIGDWILSNGTAGWTKVDNTDAVKSVNGKYGIVVLSAGDVGASALGHTHTGETILPDAIKITKVYSDAEIAAFAANTLFWDDVNQTYAFKLADGGVIQINQEPFDLYTNLEGSAINEMYVVSFCGASGNRTAVCLTDATDDTKSRNCFGMVTVSSIGINQIGRITKSGGKVRGLNTDVVGWTEGDTLYVHPTVKGTLTNIAPPAGTNKVRVGTLTVKHQNNGVIELNIHVESKLANLVDVDGTDTTILDTDEILKKDTAGLWKKVTWANVKTLLNNIFFSKTESDRRFVNQNGGTIYHITRWFTPSSALLIEAGGLTAQQVGATQFTTAMIGAKLKLTNGVNEPIITAVDVTNRRITLSFAVDASFFGQSVVVGDWGVYSIDTHVFVIGNVLVKRMYQKDGTLYFQNRSDNPSIAQFGILSDLIETYSLASNSLRFGSNFKYLFANAGNWYNTIDLGFFRASAGLLQIYDGITTTALRDLKLRSLFADKIIPNSDSSGVVIRNAADTADVVKVDTANKRTYIYLNNDSSYFQIESDANWCMMRSVGKPFIFGQGSAAYSIVGVTTRMLYPAVATNETDLGSASLSWRDLFVARNGFINKLRLGDNTTPETTLDVNGTTTLRDWVYLNNGTHTGDAVGDYRFKTVSGVKVTQVCKVTSSTKGDSTAGNWVVCESVQYIGLTDSNELIGAGSFIDLETSRSGRGSIVFGDGVGYADFIFTSAGVVTLIQYTSNVFTTVQTGTNHVIIKDNGTNVRIVNEMGSTINFNVKIQYN